jgi:tetratricopeptide (TPR) repeat protein
VSWQCSLPSLVISLTSCRFSSGRELLNALRHILRLYAESGLEPPPGNNTVETLLSASKFEGPSDKENLLMLAARLQPDPAEPNVHAKIVHQLSVMFRSRGRISDSERVITEFLSSQNSDLNREPHYFLGILHLSQANNQLYRFEFRRAREETCKWQPSSDIFSDCELRLLCDQLCTTGRVLRGEGRFDEARRCFEGCIATPGLPRSKRLLFLSHLSDVWCELDYIQRNNACQLTLQSSYLSKGREVVQQETDCARACGKPSKGLRRLLLALTEIEIRQHRFDRAECIISELLGIYSKIAEPDVNDKVGHVRTLIARARVSQLCEAEENWNAALLQNRAYNPFEEEVFTCGVIYLFISFVRLQLDDVDGSRGTFKKAIEVIRRKRPQFLMPGMGTYLFDSIRSELQSRAGLILPEIAQ